MPEICGEFIRIGTTIFRKDEVRTITLHPKSINVNLKTSQIYVHEYSDMEKLKKHFEGLAEALT